MFTIKIVKTNKGSLDLINIFQLYRSSEIQYGSQICYIAGMNKKKDSLILSPKNSNDPDDLFEASIKTTKLVLKPIRNISRNDLETIFMLAFNVKNFSGEITRGSSIVVCIDDDNSMLLNYDASTGFVLVTSIKKNNFLALNLPFIHAYLITNHYDIFGLINGGFAINKH